jgi:4-amino-4-deoxy-L-arabinose transferase-like glycosyltransferase
MPELPNAIARARPAALLALAATVVAAAILRLWGIDYGLPFSYFNDEYHEVLRALQLGSGSFNLHRVGKGGFYYVLFVEYGLYFVWLKASGAVSSAADFARDFVRDPSAFYLMGRATAALCGTLTVLVVYGIGRRAYAPGAALMAAAFLAACTLHVDLSHRIGVDVPMTLAVAAALLYALRIAESGRRSDYVVAAILAALATTTKLPGVLTLVPLTIAHVMNCRGRGVGLRGTLTARPLWLAAALFLLVLVATNPGVFVYSNPVALFTAPEVPAGEMEEALPAVTAAPNLYFFYLAVIRDALGLPLALLAAAGVALAFWRRTRADVILLSLGLVFYLAISSTGSATLYYPRYALPVIVVLVVLAARILQELWESRLPGRRVLLPVAVAILVAFPLVESVRVNHLFAQEDTRTLAKEWIEGRIPPGTRIWIESQKIKPSNGTVQLNDDPGNLARRIEYWKTAEPKQAKYLALVLETQSGVTYDLELARVGQFKSLAEYLASGVEYFVVRPDYLSESRRTNAGSVRLLEDLRSSPDVKRIQAFYPDPRERPGPAIEIYRVARAEAR